MDSINSLPPLAKTWLLDGPLAAHVDAYTANLERGSYSRQSSRSHIDALAHFAHWMARCTLTASQLDEDCVSQFLNFHLPSCDCHSMALRNHDQLRAGLGLLLEVLREERVIAELLPPTGPIAEELNRYDAHMRDARGLAVGTRKDRLYRVGQFLRWKFADRAFTGKDMLVEDLCAFITKELERVNSTSHAQSLAASFRAYFRYRLTCGDEVRGLLGTISTPAQWTLASLPRALTAVEVQRLMALMYNTGARVSEVIGVKVSDVVLDASACVHLHGKGRKDRSVPLWRSTAKSVRQWLKLNPDLGPTSALLPNRCGEAMTRSNVTQRMALAVQAAIKTMPGLEHRGISPHTIRHTTAMHLLQSGVEISVIALWLGHESPTTTHQYVEADLAMKEKALARLQDPEIPARRFKATESLLEFLKSL